MYSPNLGKNENVEPVSVLFAGSPIDRVMPWTNVLMGDGRFRVTHLASSKEDLLVKLSARPEVLVLDAAMFDGPDILKQVLEKAECLVYLVTPLQAGPEFPQELRLKFSHIKGAFVGDMNMVELAPRLYAEAIEARTKPNTVGSIWGRAPGNLGGPVSLRIIAIWNQMGGVGKTTIATNLAYEAARRGFPTLLIGLGAPDDLPLIMGLRPEPNIVKWLNNPTPEGIRTGIQKMETLDVLAGFPDMLSEAQALNTPSEAPNSIPKLITTAAHYLGYAVIVVDAPPSTLAASAISVANTLVMVSRPSLEGVMRTVEAYKTVVDRLAGEHRIQENRVYLVLNRAGSRFSADEWHRNASQAVRRSFPPIIAQIPDVPAVGALQDACRLPLTQVDEFTRALKPLADALFQMPQSIVPQIPVDADAGKQVIRLGPIKIRL